MKKKTWEKSQRETRNLISNNPNQENTTFYFSRIRLKLAQVDGRREAGNEMEQQQKKKLFILLIFSFCLNFQSLSRIHNPSADR